MSLNKVTAYSIPMKGEKFQHSRIHGDEDKGGGVGAVPPPHPPCPNQNDYSHIIQLWIDLNENLLQ